MKPFIAPLKKYIYTKTGIKLFYLKKILQGKPGNESQSDLDLKEIGLETNFSAC